MILDIVKSVSLGEQKNPQLRTVGIKDGYVCIYYLYTHTHTLVTCIDPLADMFIKLMECSNLFVIIDLIFFN